MKHLRLAALTTAGVLCFGLLAGCGTSHMSESESLPESADSGWEQLNTATPTPKTETVMPELEQKEENLNGGTDVTDDYKNSFVGTWDESDGYDIYEFKSNENLVITTGKEVANYTYWFEDNGKQVLLYIFANGDEEATTYSFTLSGSNLTLNDTDGQCSQAAGQAGEHFRAHRSADPCAHENTHCNESADAHGCPHPGAFSQPGAFAQ